MGSKYNFRLWRLWLRIDPGIELMWLAKGGWWQCIWYRESKALRNARRGDVNE
jgi:hypothetical protein